MNEASLLNVISVEGTLLTIISLLTGLWFENIEKSLSVKIINEGVNAKNYEDERKQLRLILYFKVLPLLVFSSVISIIFIPITCNIISGISEIEDLTLRLISYSEIIINVVCIFIAIIMLVYGIFIIIKLHSKKD